MFVRQRMPKHLMAYGDANYAGCVTTRKSTTGMAFMFGQHCWKFSSLTQSVLSLSVGESEFYACTKTAAVSLGLQSIMQDWGIKIGIIVRTDSSSTLGTSARRGAGKLRHIETPYLWLQQVRQRRQLQIEKFPGKTNPADLGTKILASPDIKRILTFLGMEIRNESKHQLAYAAAKA